MVKVIEKENEYIIRCPHCGRKLLFTIKDVFSSYTRGLQDSESWLDTLCEYLKDSSSECIPNVESCIDWLKSLKPQNRWKPSDEQIKALKETCDEHWESDGLDPLYTLWEQLKKLREE